jgi:hypothetical protein
VRSRTRQLGVLFVATIALGACANETYDAASARGELEAAGLTAPQARCVTRRLDVEIGRDRLAARATPTSRERAELEEILQACGVTPAAGRAS